jgi:hypothetical protein
MRKQTQKARLSKTKNENDELEPKTIAERLLAASGVDTLDEEVIASALCQPELDLLAQYDIMEIMRGSLLHERGPRRPLIIDGLENPREAIQKKLSQLEAFMDTFLTSQIQTSFERRELDLAEIAFECAKEIPKHTFAREPLKLAYRRVLGQTEHDMAALKKLNRDKVDLALADEQIIRDPNLTVRRAILLLAMLSPALDRMEVANRQAVIAFLTSYTQGTIRQAIYEGRRPANRALMERDRRFIATFLEKLGFKP